MQIHIIEESNLNTWAEYWKMFPSSIFLAAPWLESFKSDVNAGVTIRNVSEGSNGPKERILQKFNA